MEQDNKVGIALTKEACPACATLVDGPIMMNTKLTDKDAKEVEGLHGKVIGYLDKPCDNCQELMSKGFLLIGVDEDQTEDENNPYRSGNQWVIKEEIADKVFPDVSKELGYAFIGIKVAQAIGLPVKKFNNEDGNINI